MTAGEIAYLGVDRSPMRLSGVRLQGGQSIEDRLRRLSSRLYRMPCVNPWVDYMHPTDYFWLRVYLADVSAELLAVLPWYRRMAMWARRRLRFGGWR